MTDWTMENGFEALPETARVWIYQADRVLDPEQAGSLKRDLADFVGNWQTHGIPLLSYGGLIHRLFIVLAVDESHKSASGCSIDESVRFVKEMEKKYRLQFFDRTQCAYRDGEEIRLTSLHSLNDLYKKGQIDDDTIIFDNLVNTKSGLLNTWQKKLSESWHYRFVDKKRELV